MIYLHIGTLKTGSKSIQAFLGDHREALRELGWSVYRGFHKEGNNHVELHLASLRDSCETFATLKWPEARGDAYRRSVTERVTRFLAERETPHAVLSNEGLSWLRQPDEIARLGEMVTSGGQDDIRVILYLRDKADFLRSYAQQIRKVPGRRPSSDPSSSLYVALDSWIIDYQALVDAYSAGFGRERLRILDFDRERAARGSVLPSFREALDLPAGALPDAGDYFRNRSV